MSRQTTIRLTEYEIRTLRLMANEVGLPMATIIRAAIADYVQDATDGAVTYRVNTPCIPPRYRES